jgi:hypothetical protein
MRIAFAVLVAVVIAAPVSAQPPPPPCGPMDLVEVTMKDGRTLRGKLWCLDSTSVTLLTKDPAARGLLVEPLAAVRRIVKPPPGRKLAIIGGAVAGAFVGSFITDDKWPGLPMAALFAGLGAADGVEESRRVRVIYESYP